MITQDHQLTIRVEDESVIFHQIVSDKRNQNIFKNLEKYMQDEPFYGDPDFSYY